MIFSAPTDAGSLVPERAPPPSSGSNSGVGPRSASQYEETGWTPMGQSAAPKTPVPPPQGPKSSLPAPEATGTGLESLELVRWQWVEGFMDGALWPLELWPLQQQTSIIGGLHSTTRWGLCPGPRAPGCDYSGLLPGGGT